MNLIDKRDKIFIAGGQGMVGSSIIRILEKNNYINLIYPTSRELDLEDSALVSNWFKLEMPDVVILAAAKVGGIYANSKYPKDFLLKNLKIQNNVIENAYLNNCKRLLFLGSSCIYPKFANQPISEEELLKSSLEETNESYSIAKISGIKLCESLRIQNNFDAISIMPTNLYGPGDNYNTEDSHVLPALVRKFIEAKKNNDKEVSIWGSGTPLRELLHVDDLSRAIVFALEKWNPNNNKSPKTKQGKLLTYLNVGSGKEISIQDLALLISNIIDYKGGIKWDKSKPDGTPRKLLDSSRIRELGWQPNIELQNGIKETIKEFESNLQNIRTDRNITLRFNKTNNGRKKILVTGSSGQDSILFIEEALKEKNCEIIGLTTSEIPPFKDEKNDNLKIIKVKKKDYLKTYKNIVDSLFPDWVVNFMGVTSSQFVNRYDADTMMANLYLPLEFMRYFFRLNRNGKFFQPSSSYVFPKSKYRISESSPKSPSSIYGHSKNLIDKACKEYRDNGYFCINAYLFSHESYLRDKQSFSMKMIEKLRNHKNSEPFIEKLSSFGGVRIPGKRRHDNRKNIKEVEVNPELLNKIYSLK